MNILLISQCDKRALKETRRILDQFAERKGSRVWQTPITQNGLDTLRKLLRQTARKNTAVACHWIRGLNHSELLWIVGDLKRFNAEGSVPTETTKRNVLRKEDENDWHTGEEIRILAQLAALMHDLGKASVAFQMRLRGELEGKNLYRHEWVSLRLFQAFVKGQSDQEWLTRLSQPESWDEADWLDPTHYLRDGLGEVDRYPFRHLPPVAAAVAWLIVTHHRMPALPNPKKWGAKSEHGVALTLLDAPLKGMAHDWNEVVQEASEQQRGLYWQPAQILPVMRKSWRSQAARLATRWLQRHPEAQQEWLDNPYVMHIARLSLMLADHYVSSLPTPSVVASEEFESTLWANTQKGKAIKGVAFKQSLEDHLVWVAKDAGEITHALPNFERYLPRLSQHRILRKRNSDARFQWQDKAADMAASMRVEAESQGAFIVNMASTGCGKTLGNARILYALSHPQLGMRFTYALGLRTLTQQTGRSYREMLQLSDDELAILVGGSASRELFDYYEAKAEATGSASSQALLEEDSHVFFDSASDAHPLLSRALRDGDIRKLLLAPILVCTVDHIVPATESMRGGRQIAPMLRLMSSDLILDELDDYDLNDLPALTRLVYFTGLLGAKVILSSATLPPALIEGMFNAYRTGRQGWARNRGLYGQNAAHLEVPCLLVDEFSSVKGVCGGDTAFMQVHGEFIEKRIKALQKATPICRADIHPVPALAQAQRPSAPKGKASEVEPQKVFQHLSHEILKGALQLHHRHAHQDSVSGKSVSFGLVRIANISTIIEIAKIWSQHAEIPNDTRVHLCVYHARFPLMQRSAIEAMLDQTLNRRKGTPSVFETEHVKKVLQGFPEQHHLFVVLASPVCEVGRDWDADWAIAEPSSMRSLIQLAGRVQRHRRQPPEQSNLFILERNAKALKASPKPSFHRPGFEKESTDNCFRVTQRSVARLLREDEYSVISAIPRIKARPEDTWEIQTSLVDLEHARMTAGMRQRDLAPPKLQRRLKGVERDEAMWAWVKPDVLLTGLLPQHQPFREQTDKQVTLAFLPDEDETGLIPHRIQSVSQGAYRKEVYVSCQLDVKEMVLQEHPNLSPWQPNDLLSLLKQFAEDKDLDLRKCAEKFATVEVKDASPEPWFYHEWLGFA